jgi:hypothetical protein
MTEAVRNIHIVISDAQRGLTASKCQQRVSYSTYSHNKAYHNSRELLLLAIAPQRRASPGHTNDT